MNEPKQKRITAADKVLEGASTLGTLAVLVMIGGIVLLFAGIINEDILTSIYGVATIILGIVLSAAKKAMIGLAEITEASRLYIAEVKRKEVE